MKHTRRLLILAAAVVGAAGLATAGWAYWTTSGSGSASASVGTLNPPTIGTTTQQGLGMLRVNWTASTGDVTPTGYYVQRYAGTTLDGYACGSSPAPADLKPAPSCDDQDLTAAGPYNYKVTAVFRSWTAQSGASNPVSVLLDNTPPDVAFTSTPTINLVNRTSVAVAGTGENGAAISVEISDAGAAHTTTPLTTVVSGGAWSVSGINASALVDGTVTYKVTATDAAHNSAQLTQAAVKDTVAPSAPTAVGLANGLGQGGAYINDTNKGSISYGVTIPASPANSTTDVVRVTLTSDQSVNGTATSPGTAGGTVTVSGLNTTSLADGAVSVSAIVTDAAGNSSDATSTTTPKDTAAAAPTSVTIANGQGQAGAYINNANKASVNYTVVVPGNGGNAITDTVTVTLNASVHGSVASPGTAGGAVTVSGLYATALADGSVSVSAVVTDLAGNTSAPAGGSTPKDTAPPAVGVSTTTSPVNNANKASTTASGTNEAGATVSVVASDGDGHSSPAANATVTGTTWSASGIDLTGLNDGTITYTATATDSAGNTATATRTTTKDTVAPQGLTISCNISTSSGNGPCSGGAGNASGDSTNVTLTITQGTTTVVNETFARSGSSWSKNVNLHKSKTYLATVQQQDSAGNTSTATYTINT